jgi:SlyX protein
VTEDERLTNAEVKLAFLERTVEDLDSVVLELNREVQMLRREVEQLRGQLAQAGAVAAAKPEDEVPPHY